MHLPETDKETAVIALFFFVLVIAIFSLIFLAKSSEGKSYDAQKTAFMDECLQENKQYKCDTMWGHVKVTYK